MSSILIIVYCVLVALASLGGGWLPTLVRLTHVRMQLAMSFVGGLMLGVGLLHLLPHAIVETNSVDYAVIATVVGLVVMFCMIRILHVHQHSHDEALAGLDHEHDHDCDHQDHAVGEHDQSRVHGLSWLGLFFGLALHTLIDGVALAASVAAGGHGHEAVGLLGLGTFLAILLHKPLDALSITSLMRAAGWSKRWISAANVGFAVMCPLGAVTFFFGVQELASPHLVVGLALGFAAGVFLCIALSDILPEVQFHRHHRVTLTLTLVGGVLLAAAIGLVEPEQAHKLAAPDDRAASESTHPHPHPHPHDR